jgi:predicted small secreted protein
MGHDRNVTTKGEMRMTRDAKRRALAPVAMLAVAAALAGCTTREALTGAAAGAAGYVVGQELEEDD